MIPFLFYTDWPLRLIFLSLNKPKCKGNMSELHKCKICGYIYNSDLGDPISGIKEGTPFNNIPESWVCPLCGAGCEDFEAIN